jgi:hypothetical protein
MTEEPSKIYRNGFLAFCSDAICITPHCWKKLIATFFDNEIGLIKTRRRLRKA